MRKRSTFFAAAGIASLLVLMITSLPIPRQTSTTPFTLEDGSTGTVTLIVPERLRQGDWAEIELDVTFEAVIPPEQNVKIKTSLQTTGMEASPAGEVTAVIPVKEIAPFRWRIRSGGAGEQRLTIWCFRQDADGQTLILAKELEFEVKSFLGITFRFTRWMLGMVVVLCALLFFSSIKKRKNQLATAYLMTIVV